MGLGWKIIMFVESGLDELIVILNWSTVALRDRKIQLFWIHNSIQIQTNFCNSIQGSIQQFAEGSNSTQDSIQPVIPTFNSDSCPSFKLNSDSIQY